MQIDPILRLVPASPAANPPQLNNLSLLKSQISKDSGNEAYIVINALIHNSEVKQSSPRAIPTQIHQPGTCPTKIRTSRHPSKKNAQIQQYPTKPVERTVDLTKRPLETSPRPS